MALQLLLGIAALSMADQSDNASPSMSAEEEEGVSLLQYRVHMLPRKLDDEPWTPAAPADGKPSGESTFEAMMEGLLTLLAFVGTTCAGGAVGRLRQVDFSVLPQILRLGCGRARQSQAQTSEEDSSQ